MGIEVPDTYRGEFAQASNWSVVSKPKVEEASGEESLSKGVRKRKLEEGEEEEHEFLQPTRKQWGKSTKSYPGQDTPDLDALLAVPLPLKKETTETKVERQHSASHDAVFAPTAAKRDLSNTANEGASPTHNNDTTAGEGVEATKDNAPRVKQESMDEAGQTVIDQATSMPLFKKRRNQATSSNAT